VLLKYSKQQIQAVLNPSKENDLLLSNLLKKLLDFNKPQVLDFRKKDNVITVMDKNYQKTLLAFQENGIQGKDFTIFEFYNTLEYFEKRNEEMKEKTDKLKQK
jgi:hypothetical protein